MSARKGTTHELSDRSAKPSLASGLVVAFVTLLVTLLILEGVTRVMFKSPYQWDRRLMFFSEARNFRNTDWGGFIYQPNEQVHAATYYITQLDPPEIRLEYEYEYTTNASGFVQLYDVSGSKPSILFVGDSFTEGQGAEPWFYEMERSWPESSLYQIVNGGILGTGVEAWGKLYRSLSPEVEIAKLVIIFISEDWNRPVWQFPPQTLECLRSATECTGTEDFYGLPSDPIERQAQVNRIAQYRLDHLAESRSRTSFLERSAVYQKLVVPSFRRIGNFLRSGSLRSDASKQVDVSKSVATSLVNELGRGNVLFIFLPQKNELDAGPNAYGREAIDFILQGEFQFVDGRAACGLSSGDYHELDGHPNAEGYAKIRSCVEHAVQDAFQPLSPVNR